MNLEWFLFEFAGLFYLKAGAVLLAGVVAALIFRNHSSTTRYWSWNLCLLLLVLVVPLSFALPSWNLTMLAPGYSSLPPVEEVAFAGDGIAASTINELLNSEVFHANHDLSAWELLWGALLSVWVIGSAVLLAKLGADLIGLWLTSRSGGAGPEAWNLLVEEIRLDAGCALPVRVRVSEGIGSPLIWGFIRPTILLPSGAMHWSEERLRMVLLHECLHAARFDHTMTILAQLVRCLYWGNPLTWLAVHRHSIERELSCDERVIGCGKDRVEYAEELLAITRDLKREVRYASVAMTQQHGLKARITSILGDHLRLRFLNRGAARVLTLVALALTLSIASAKLVQEPDPGSLESLVADLFGRDISVADDAARHLGEIGEKARPAVPYLVKTAREVATPHTRMQSIAALGKIGGKKALTGLIGLSESEDVWTRYSAVAQLERFDDDAALSRLWWVWEEGSDPYVRLRAYRGLAVHGKVGKLDPYFDKFEAKDAELREFAAGQLGEVCQLESVRWTLEQTDQPSDQCQRKLAWLFESDPETEVREAAARSLARLDPDRLRAALPELAEDQRMMAEAALEAFTR